MRLDQIAAALFVTLLPLPALALSVGAPQGSAWIGQPLDLRVPLVLDGEDATGSLCTQVELRQGDAAHAEAGVQALLEPGIAPERPNLRIRTRRPISEPLLNLRVKVGCQGVSSREFALLADPPPVLAAMPVPPPASAAAAAAQPVRQAQEPAAPARMPSAGSQLSTPPPTRSAQAPSSRTTARMGERPRRSEPSAPSARSAATPRAGVAPRKSAAKVAAAPTAPSPHGRLQLDALEPLAPSLRVARWGEASAGRPALTGAGTGSALQMGPQGAAALPSTPSEPVTAPSASVAEAPSPTLHEVERTTQLEAALAELRNEARQNQMTQAELRGELTDARSSRYNNPLVYVLGLLLFMALIALWMLWRASRRAPESPWGPAASPAAPQPRLRKRRPRPTPDADPEDTGPMPLYFTGAVSSETQSGRGAHDGGWRETADDPQGEQESSASLAPRADGPPASARSLDVGELFDVQQQAEFFSSLGQHEQAVEVLRHYVNEHPKASALAYLELLHLYHRLGREADYEALRQQCQQALNVRIPAFRSFGSAGGRRLEQYPEVRARLQSHWPQEQTLEVIEELLFRTDPDGEAFDLSAYRELLMLYGLVQEQRPQEGQAWPSLDGLLSLSRKAREGMADEQPTVSPWTEPAGSLAAATNGFDAMPEPPHTDFQSTWPPALELDMDLARLESQQIDTMPMALRPAQAAPDGDQEGPDLTLVPRTEAGDLPHTDRTTGAGANADARKSKQAPVSAFLP